MREGKRGAAERQSGGSGLQTQTQGLGRNQATDASHGPLKNLSACTLSATVYWCSFLPQPQMAAAETSQTQSRRLRNGSRWAHGLWGEGDGSPLQSSCLENPVDGGAWWAAVHGVAKSRARLSDFTFTFHLPALEKEMATHSSVLAWRIPGTAEPGGLPSMGSHRVRHD